jgi:hypothetical protein
MRKRAAKNTGPFRFLKELRKDKVDCGLEGLAGTVATALVTFTEKLNICFVNH